MVGVEGLSAFVADLLATLRAGVAPDFCPGGWPWAVSALGIGVGLLPALGAVVVALLRRGIGSRYGAPESAVLIGLGIVSAGLLPFLVFTATGRVFAVAAAGGDVAGLSNGQQESLGEGVCFVSSQAEYLGSGSVADSFGGDGPMQMAIAAVLLAGCPMMVAMLVAAQARIALRRGPSWPAKFFWLPVVALAFVTASLPAGSSGHLWLGATVGAFLGMIVVLFAGVPSRETVRRSLAPPQTRARPPEIRPEDRRAARAPQQPVPEQRKLADRMAERFASRPVDPPVRPAPAAPLAPTPGPLQPPVARTPPRTLVAAAPPFQPAQAQPRFRLVKRLGSGGFGRVWLAEDARLGQLVAVKAAHAPDEETEQRIRREARALASIRHPHCVRIHDLVPASSDPGLAELDGMVIVMEYVEGPSLGERVRSRGVVDDLAAARIWAAVAGALDAAHSRGVMHRDVKPGNVVVDSGGLAHLIDFGIARATGDATMTIAGFVLGTPDFLAPEVACGERATPASDAWQLAATISYALTGHPPRGVHADAVSGLRAAAAGAPLAHLPGHSAHAALLRAAMHTEPGRRPALRTVAATLEQWLGQSATTRIR